MNKIFFATGNKSKIAYLQRYFDSNKIMVEIEQIDCDLTEPQADSSTEVAIAKARQAYELTKNPVVVEDSSLHINALNGFPGPYIKHMINSMGVDGIANLMSKYEDKSAYFLSTLVFIDESGKEYIFEDEPYGGVIMDRLPNSSVEVLGGEMSRIFIPDGTSKTLFELSDEEAKLLMKESDSYQKFANWIKENY